MARPLVIFLGPTGAGKSVQAARLAAAHGWVHVSAGALLRAQNNPMLMKIMSQGELVSSDLIDEILAKELARLNSAQGIVLDGYPRVMTETDWLMKHLPDFNFGIKRVIHLAVTKEESVKRILNRGRSDDSQLSVEEKWDYFEKDVKPVIEYFKQAQLLVEVNGMGSIDQVAARVAKAV